MLRVLKLLWKSLGEYYYDIISLTWINILWLVTTIGPALILGGIAQVTGVGSLNYAWPVLLLLFFPPSFGALMYTMQQFHHGESVDRHTFATGYGMYWKLSYLVFVTDLVVGGLLVVNFLFYFNQPSTLFRFISVVWAYAIFFWLSLQPYLWPLMVEQERKKLWLFYRNSALLILDNFGFSLSLTIVLFIFCALCIITGLPALILLGSTGGLFVHKALGLLLQKYDDAGQRSRMASAEK